MYACLDDLDSKALPKLFSIRKELNAKNAVHVCVILNPEVLFPLALVSADFTGYI